MNNLRFKNSWDIKDRSLIKLKKKLFRMIPYLLINLLAMAEKYVLELNSFFIQYLNSLVQ